MKTYLLTTSAAALLVCAPRLSAAQVYERTEGNGTRLFTSRPVPGSKKADLPPLLPDEPKARLDLPRSCSVHGGTDCARGADADGSVICYDGFRGAAARFRFTCSASRLSVVGVSEAGADGTFTVSVRNDTSVAARDASVVLRPARTDAVPPAGVIPGEGPASVEPLSMAEYTFRTSLPKGSRPDVSNFEAKCGNCGG